MVAEKGQFILEGNSFKCSKKINLRETNDVQLQYNMKQFPFLKFHMLLYRDVCYHFQSFFLAEFQAIILFEFNKKNVISNTFIGNQCLLTTRKTINFITASINGN